MINLFSSPAEEFFLAYWTRGKQVSVKTRDELFPCHGGDSRHGIALSRHGLSSSCGQHLRIASGRQLGNLCRRPDMITDPSLHGRRDPKRLVDAGEVVPHEVEGDGGLVVLDLLREG